MSRRDIQQGQIPELHGIFHPLQLANYKTYLTQVATFGIVHLSGLWRKGLLAKQLGGLTH